MPRTSKSYTVTMLASESIAAVRASSSPGMCAAEASDSCARSASPSLSSMHLIATLRWMRVSHATCTVPNPPAPASCIGRYLSSMSPSFVMGRPAPFRRYRPGRSAPFLCCAKPKPEHVCMAHMIPQNNCDCSSRLARAFPRTVATRSVNSSATATQDPQNTVHAIIAILFLQ